MNINYICSWDTKDKKKTWSGTTYSLYEALKQKSKTIDSGFIISDLKEKYFKIKNIAYRDKKIYSKFYNKSILNYYQKQIDNIQVEPNNKVLEIGDLGITYKNDYYIYQDLSVDFLIDCRNNKPELFKYSGFERYSNKEFELRSEYQKKIYNKAKGIFTMSNFLKNHLIKYSNIPENKVYYVGAGTNLDYSLIDYRKKGKNKILFVGRDFYRKGGDIVCEAFKILKEKYIKDSELYIIGTSKKLSDKLRKKYSYNGINIIGEINDKKELSNYFNMCNIFCMPSRFEAYGIVFIEALIYGLPCIGRNAFAMEETIKDGINGYLIDRDDNELLAKKMNELLKNNYIEENVRKNKEYYLKEYSWENVASRIINILESQN